MINCSMDIISSINDTKVSSMEEVSEIVDEISPAAVVCLELINVNSGEKRKVYVVAGSDEDSPDEKELAQDYIMWNY